MTMTMLLVWKAAPGGQGTSPAARLFPGSRGRLLRNAKPDQEHMLKSMHCRARKS